MQFENHNAYNCRITLDDGQEYKVYANWIHNQGLDYWQGWHCDAGATSFYVDSNLSVWSGMCQNDYLGSALDTNWSRLHSGTTCRQDRCTGCTGDLLARKFGENNA